MQQIIVYLFVKNDDTEKIAFNIIGRMMLNVYIIYIKIVDKKASRIYFKNYLKNEIIIWMDGKEEKNTWLNKITRT